MSQNNTIRRSFSGDADNGNRWNREIGAVIQQRAVSTLFQPLVDARARRVFGYEALSRGPSNSRLHAPANLAAAARRNGMRMELDFLCAELAAIRFARARLSGRLFVNVSPDCLYEEPQFPDRFLAALSRSATPAQMCVIELTEDGLLDDYAMLRPALRQLRDAGVEVAIDDLGAGSSGLRIWSEVRPNYVKIDRYFISDIDTDSTKVDFVRSIVDLGHSIGCRVIAEGVETAAQCRELIALGIDTLQGYLFGRPTEAPAVALDALEGVVTTHPPTAVACAEQLAIDVPAIAPHTSVAQVAELFRTGTTRNMLVVVEASKPRGVIRRERLFALLSKPYHPEVYNRKPITAVMDTDAVVVDGQLRLEGISRLLTRGTDSRLADEFVITRSEQYLGIGQTLDLLRVITEQQVRVARHANPLTLLPGNGPIGDCIRRLLGDQQSFVVCYVDLDYFKPYNDVYGYAQGDQLILHLADSLRTVLTGPTDFLGHVGGDDFVLVLRCPDWARRIQDMQAAFAESLRSYYSLEHYAAGGIEAADRSGAPQLFPLLSISVAALDSRAAGCSSPEAVAQLLVEVKKLAKLRVGNSLLYRSNVGIADLTRN